MVEIPVHLEPPIPGSKDGPSKSTPGFRIEDRRSSARTDGESPTPAKEESRRFPTYVEELQARVENAEKRLAEKVKWMEEEVKGVRERLSKEQDRKLEAEKRRIVQSFLEVVDDLERALAAARLNPSFSALLDGLKIIQSSFLLRLQQLDVKVLDLQGRPFDPNLSEAVVLSDVHIPERDQTVIEVLENGYQMGEQLLRPAKVRVGRFICRPEEPPLARMHTDYP